MKLHCKFSIWNAVTLHDTFILTNKKNILRMREKSKCSFNDNWTRHWDIFNIFFAEINKKLQYFRKRRLFFYYEIFFNEHLNEEIIFTVPESSHFTFDELMDELLCVFFFHYFEHILFLIICICSYVDSKNVHFPLEVMLQCQSAIFPL